MVEVEQVLSEKLDRWTEGNQASKLNLSFPESALDSSPKKSGFLGTVPGSEMVSNSAVGSGELASAIVNVKALISSGDYEIAESILIRVLSIQPNYQPAAYLLGMVHLKRNAPHRAEVVLTALLQTNPAFEVRLMLAHSWFQQGKDSLACEAYLNLLFESGDRPDVSFEIFKNLGSIHVRSGDFDEALDCYNKAFALNKHSDILLVNFGVLEIRKGQWDQALEHFREAVAINEKNVKAWIGLALVHRTKGDFELSWGNLLKAVDEAPTDRQALALVVDWVARDGAVDNGIRVLDRASSIEILEPELLVFLATLYERSGQIHLAYMEALKAIELDPLHEQSRLYFAHIQQKCARTK